MGRIGSKASVPLTLPEEGGVSAHVMQRHIFAPRQHFTCVCLVVLQSLAHLAVESSSATFLASNQSISTRRYLALRSLTGKCSPWPLASLLGTCHREPTNPHGCRALPLRLGNSGDLCAVTGYQPYTTTCGACWRSTHRLSAVEDGGLGCLLGKHSQVSAELVYGPLPITRAKSSPARTTCCTSVRGVPKTQPGVP